MLDIAVIGGGPAGLTAGLYAARGGASCTVFEELFAGGQAAKTAMIENYPAFPEGVEGFALGAKIEEQAAKFGLKTEYAQVTALSLSGPVKRIELPERTLEARAVILATGASPRLLGVPGEEALTGAGVSYCATCDGAFFREKEVAVVGGGDTALADALYLARFCSRVTVIHRRDALRAAESLQKQAFAEPKIAFLWNSVVTQVVGGSAVEALEIENVTSKERTRLPVSGVFVAVGIVPRTELVREALACRGDGAILTDVNMQTSLPGVYAAGDVRDTPLRQVVTACADGAVAATHALSYLLTARAADTKI